MARKKTAVADTAPADQATDTLGPDTATDPPGEGTTTPPPAEAADHPQPERPPAPHAPGTNGNGEKRHPVFKVGPIATDRDNSVEAAVWDRVIQTRDGREFTVYSVTVQASWRDADGSWKKSQNFRGSQVYALVYCLQRCSDWILAQRDPSNTCPF